MGIHHVAAPDGAYPCAFAGVQSISLPLYPDRPKSPTFTYKYQIVGDLSQAATAIVFLPGGPGDSSMNDFSIPGVRDNLVAAGLPADAAWIFFDPRTVGCNRGDATVFPDDSLTTEYLAGDVLAVLRALAPKNYVIFAHSYGTQWATVVAGRASAGEAPAPHAVLLSGILGRGEADGTFAIPYNIIHYWNELTELLPASALTVLSQASPLSFDDATWTRMINPGLYGAYHVVGKRFANPLLEHILELAWPDSAQKDLLAALQSAANPKPSLGQSDFSERLYNKVDCHEFSPGDSSAIFSQGKMIVDPDNTTCQGEAFDRPYDSAKWQIKSPIYYLAGDHDPAAPWLGALYHFQNQTHAHRNFVRVPGGGHDALGAVFPDCKDAVWTAIWSDADLTAVVPKCLAPVQLELAGP